MDQCNEFKALLDPFIDGELPEDQAAAVRAHLTVCPACRAYVEDALAIRAAFPTAEETAVPEGFADRVMAAVQASAPQAVPTVRTAPKTASRWKRTAVSLAACFALVLLLQALPGMQDAAQEESQPAPVSEPLPQSRERTAPAEEQEAAADTEQPAEEEASVSADGAPAENGTRTVHDGLVAQDVPCFARLTLTAQEAGTLLESAVPLSQEAGETRYALTDAELTALLDALAAAGVQRQPEAGSDPQAGTALVIVLH